MNTREDTYAYRANITPIKHRIALLSLESALSQREMLLSLPPDDDGSAEKKEMLSLSDSHIHLLKSKTEQEETQ